MCVTMVTRTHFRYCDLISIENLFQAWIEFRNGKRKKIDVQLFERKLEDNLFTLQKRLENRIYKHGSYKSFYVNDPKRRHIHKASVTDRIVHHLLYKYLYEIFDPSFISDSYSCRLGKGIHKAVLRLEKTSRKISRNYSRTCWSLRCDIKRFFASVDHKILLKLLNRKIRDKKIVLLVREIVESFDSEFGMGKGIPLGNLTSQVFANIYLNEFDQFVKQELRVKYYLRYADDFLILSNDKEYLINLVDPIKRFLFKLKLDLHPEKILFRKLEWGVDFLGYTILPYYKLPRTKTKRRIYRKILERMQELEQGKITGYQLNQAVQSYLGYLSHANTFKISQLIRDQTALYTER